MKHKRVLGLAAAALLAASGARAHVTLTPASAAPGTWYKAVLRVPHGCNGAATTALRVRVPDGMVDVKPQPKPGWQLDVVAGDYAQPQKLHGNTLTRGVREIAWRGELPDAWFDEFSFMGYLVPGLATDEPLYFPVVQQCADAVVRWIDTSGEAGVEHPAPVLRLVAPDGAARAAAH